jgi:nucleotide-binding universal stress UspA family protein
LRVVWAWRMADVWEEAMTGRHDAAIPPMHELEKLARRRLAAVVDALAGDLVSDVELHLDHDPEPARPVLRAAEGADMLVLGSRGRGRVASAVLGSVSVRCLREATCPVLVIPHRMATTPAPRLDAGHRGAPRTADDTPAATAPRAATPGN